MDHVLSRSSIHSLLCQDVLVRISNGLHVAGEIRDRPQAVSIAAPEDGDTIEEGESAQFILTRHGPKDGTLAVNVGIEDPGSFRRGNHWRNVPDPTAVVTFQDGQSTATLTVSTRDDWRDIPDNALTATVLDSQDDRYRVAEASEGAASASVTVTDNDVAPQLEVSANSSTVEEGQQAYFTITRTGDFRNDLEILVHHGPQGEQESEWFFLDGGANQQADRHPVRGR